MKSLLIVLTKRPHDLKNALIQRFDQYKLRKRLSVQPFFEVSIFISSCSRYIFFITFVDAIDFTSFIEVTFRMSPS
jgi:hypothetical protein